MGRKSPVSPSLTTKFPSGSVKIRDNPSKIFGHEKTPETLIFRGFLHVRWSRSALAELRSTTCRFEAVLVEFYDSNPLIYQRIRGLNEELSQCLTHFQALFGPLYSPLFLIARLCHNSIDIVYSSAFSVIVLKPKSLYIFTAGFAF